MELSVQKRNADFQHTAGEAEIKHRWQAAELPVGPKVYLCWLHGHGGIETWRIETFL